MDFKELSSMLSQKRTDLPVATAYPLLNPNKFRRTLIIDVHNLAWKSWYAKFWHTMKNSKGEPSGHVYGAFVKINAFIQRQCVRPRIPSTLVLVADEYPVKQKILFPEYKGNRGERDFNPVPEVLAMLKLFPHILVSIPSKDEEADSIIASYIVQNPTFDHCVLTSDKDMWQLWNKAHFFDKADKQFLEADYTKVYGKIKPSMIPLYKAIFGDSSDNIPSILSDKSEVRFAIRKILKHIKKPNELFKHLHRIPIKYESKLITKKDQIRTMYKVAKLHTKSKIQVDVSNGNYLGLKKLLLEKYECPSLTSTLDKLISL